MITQVAATPGRWKHVYDAADPAAEPYPGAHLEKLSSLQRLLVLRALRPDKVVGAVTRYVASQLGEEYTQVRTLAVWVPQTHSPLLTAKRYGAL
jgi:dynein heavy chain